MNTEHENPSSHHCGDSHSQPIWARGLAVALTVATFLLIGTGGLVTSYNAGLAVPDWPASFGKWFLLPARIWADLAVMLEHNHRLTGTVSGLICIATLIATGKELGWRSRLTALAWFILAAYVYQGIMGGLRVTEKSIPLAVIHGIQGQLLFVLVVLLAGWLGPWPGRIREAVRSGAHDRLAVRSGLYRLAWVFMCLLVVQLALGAIVRHTSSASAIPDAPAVYGGWFPPTDPRVIEKKFYELGGGEWSVYVKEPALEMQAIESETTPNLLDHVQKVPAKPPSVGLVLNQYMHRLIGMIVLPIVGLVLLQWLSPLLGRAPGLRGPVIVMCGLFVVQVLLGLSVIWSRESPYIASSHQAVGAALLGVGAMILIRLHWIRRYS